MSSDITSEMVSSGPSKPVAPLNGRIRTKSRSKYKPGAKPLITNKEQAIKEAMVHDITPAS